jgi:hypothetical protein
MDTNNINALATILGSKATLALLVVYLMNWLKSSKLAPVINYGSSRLNHLVAVVLTGAAGLGIHFTWNSQAHSLTIAGLSAATIGSGLWSWLQQYLVTKFTYHMVRDKISPATPGLNGPQLTGNLNTAMTMAMSSLAGNAGLGVSAERTKSQEPGK